MREAMLTAWVVTVIGLAMGQQDVTQCRGRCNLALCLQVTENAVNVEVNENIAKALTRSLKSIDHECESNIGMVFYRHSIAVNDMCPMWPHHATHVPLFACIDRIVAAQNRPSRGNNELHVCLDFIYMDQNFLKFSNSVDCRYTVAAICDRDLVNPGEVMAKAEKLKNKGAVIYCFLIGNTMIPYNPMFDSICANITQASDYPSLWRGVENMHGELNCCDDPIPTRPPPGPCDGCKIVNGVGYNPHPTRCDCWNRCLFDETGTSVYHVTNCCQCGLFWSQDLLTCVPAGDFDCPTDPCRGSSLQAWPYPGNCRAYWVCNGPRSTNAICCPDGEEFNPRTQSCQNDANTDCIDLCPCDLATTTEVCPFRPNPLDKHTYYVASVGGVAPQIMPCAPGTDFDPATCKCSIFVGVSQPPCPIDFDLRCTELPLLDHANNAYIANFGVGVNPASGQCLFGGDDRLLVPRYANYDWRNRFAIYVKYDGQSNENDNAPLVSNTDCDEPSSVELRLLRDGGLTFIEAFIKTNVDTYTVRVEYKPAEINEAFMFYDGQNLRLCVKYADSSVSTAIDTATGLVLRCKCALQIGYGWQNRYFSGIISDVRVYINCIPNNNICP